MDSTQRPIGPNDVARRNPKTKVIIGFQKVSGNYEAMPSGKEKGALKLTASNLKLIAFEEEKDEGGYRAEESGHALLADQDEILKRKIQVLHKSNTQCKGLLFSLYRSAGPVAAKLVSFKTAIILRLASKIGKRTEYKRLRNGKSSTRRINSTTLLLFSSRILGFFKLTAHGRNS